MTDTATEAKPGQAAGEVSLASLTRVAQLDVWDIATTALLIGLAAIALLTLRSYAVSNDEPVQHRYGELILDYYRSGFVDRALFSFKDLYLYGGLFDIIAVSVSRIIPLEVYEAAPHPVPDVRAWRHRRRGGDRAACGGIARRADRRHRARECGAWYGAMFNHTKDIPFAAAMAGATLMLIRCARDLPSPRPRDVALLGLLAGVALGVRVLGLLIPVYVVFALLLYGPRPWPPLGGDRARFAMRSAVALLPALALAYVIMVAAWPWAAQAPLNPLRALVAFSDFHYTIRTQLAGQVYDMSAVPRLYVPIYILVRVPLATLCGAVLAIAFALWPRNDEGSSRLPRNDIAIIALTAIFPVACEVISRGPAFTGLRHFLFVLPPLAVLAGVGLDATLTALARHHRGLARATMVAMAALYLGYASILVRLHPYEYVFYNTLVGGLEGASRRYDTDYWVNSMPEMVDELEAYLRRTEPADARRPGRIYSVAVCGERLSFERSVTLPQLRWADMPQWEQADFFIAPTQMYCDRILDGKVIGTVERLGTAIGYVKDRRALIRPAAQAAR